MATRIYEFSKKIGISSKDILDLLQKNNSEISIEINQTFDICDIFEDITSEVIYYIGYYWYSYWSFRIFFFLYKV